MAVLGAMLKGYHHYVLDLRTVQISRLSICKLPALRHQQEKDSPISLEILTLQGMWEINGTKLDHCMKSRYPEIHL